MTIRHQRFCHLLAAIYLAILAALPASANSPVGNVAFENSGSPEAQEPFLRGLALLHDFEYSRAAEAFREAQQVDPDFAMAYWGEAMTYNHPVWMEQDQDKALRALERLGKKPKDRLAAAKTERERAYLNAIERLYGAGDKKSRDFAYHDAMRAVHETYPDDVNATAFYALSTLGLAHDGRDFALYMRSAALLEEVFPDNRSHPGVLHYLIHSYDDPVHAPLGLRAARLYADVAPDAGHAQHMTSHIFVAMGMWDEVIARNQQAIKVVNRQRAEAGQEPGFCGHYNEWLVYGLLQQGKVDRADVVIAACRANAQRELADKPAKEALEPYRSQVFSWSDMAMRRVMETGTSDAETALDLPEGTYLKSRLLRAYGDVIAARGDNEKLQAAHQSLQSISEAIRQAEADLPDVAPTFPQQRKVLLLQASGLEKLSADRQLEGIVDLRAAADLEASLPPEFGPPAIPKPGFELLGEELERLGQFDQAREAFKKALALAPNRRLSVLGLKRVDSNNL